LNPLPASSSISMAGSNGTSRPLPGYMPVGASNGSSDSDSYFNSNSNFRENLQSSMAKAFAARENHPLRVALRNMVSECHVVYCRIV
jgi:hypothetical protein